MKTALEDITIGADTSPAERDPLFENRSKAGNDRESWAARYREARAFTEKLCAPLEIEDYVIQSMPDASPAKWHLAHTSWFFETFLLKKSLPGRKPSEPLHSYLFNSYYNAVGPMHCRAQRGMISRPTVGETFEYRNQIDKAMLELIERATEPQWREISPVLELGLNHEQQHQELLLTDIKHMLAQNPMHPACIERASPAMTAAAELHWIGFPEGIHWIGHAGEGFAFDNEGPRHREFLEAFTVGSRLVTHGEYLAFMEAGGYERPELWLSLGWATRREQAWNAPLHWKQQDGRWFIFTLAGLRQLDPSEPVSHVSYFEADAYSRWAGARLPTEAEWEIASQTVPIRGNFAESECFHPRAAGQGSRGDLHQMFGDVWEWTRSSYSPYPRYRPAAGAIGEYNGKFMCNQYVLRGGSCATSETHIRRTYRNFFAPDKRWQFTGIRLANDVL